MQFHLKLVSIFFENVCQDKGQIDPADSRNKDLISMYRGPFVSGFVNILVYISE